MEVPRAYQRARRPEEKAERTAQILDAARALMGERLDSSALSLRALAERAGMAKSNVYRYFESREAVLLALLSDETRAWAGEVVGALDAIDRQAPRRERLDAVAASVAALTARRPVMCQLLSVLPSTLEHNTSFASIQAYKLDSIALIGGLATAMRGAVPELTLEQHARLLHHGLSLIIGGWPLARPSEITQRVLEETPELAPYAHAFEADLREAVGLLARGML